MATTENRETVEADIVPPCQRETGQCGLPECSFLGHSSSVANELSSRRETAARRGAPWMNGLAVDMYGSVPYT